MDKFDRIALTGVQAVTPVLQRIALNNKLISPDGSTSERKLQMLGMDLAFINQQGQFVTCEVKTSNQDTTNMFVELISNVVNPTFGWLFNIQPDLLIYVNIVKSLAVLMKWIPFKAWTETYIEDHRNNLLIQADDRKSAVGIWIPLKEIAYGIGKDNFGSYHLGQPEEWQGKFRDMMLA